MVRAQVLICGGTGCTSSGSKKIQEAFVKSLEEFKLTEENRPDCIIHHFEELLKVFPGEGVFDPGQAEDPAPRVQ